MPIRPENRRRYPHKERNEARRRLGNLLAVIHRDGGHYQAEHGDERAYRDGLAAASATLGALDEARAQLVKAVEILSDAVRSGAVCTVTHRDRIGDFLKSLKGGQR